MNKKLGGLQSLRGIAALSVVFQHVTFYVCSAKGVDYHPYLRIDLGSFGVELFFVISGFVMAGCMREGRSFLLNRALRIYPGFWLAVALSSVLLWNVTPWHVDAKSLLLFPTPDLNPSYLVPYWTLIYEVAFYLVTFGIVMVGTRQATNICLAWLIAIVGVSQYADIIVAAPGLAVFFSKMDAYFIVGMLAAIHRDQFAKVPAVGFALAAVALWCMAMGIGQASLLAHHMLLAITYGIVVLLCAERLSAKPLQKLGDASYGVYLIHVPILTVLIQKLGWLSVGDLWIVVFSVTTIAAVAFGIVESRLHKLIKRATRMRRLSTITAGDLSRRM